jgi:hypothetical protein
MPSDAPTNTLPRGLWSTLWPWLIVALGLVLAGAIRLRLLNMPLERDEGEYAYLGQLLLQGVPPYELVYTMKLPGTGLVYTLGMAVFGQTAAGVHLILLLANSLTTIFVFLLGRRLGGDLAGTLAAVAHSVMSVCPAVVGLAAHATHFVVLFAVPAVLLLLKADHGKRQPGLCFGLFAVAYLIFHAWQRGTLFTLPFARPLLIFAFGLMLPLVLTALALAAAGDFGRFWFWTFTYARHYETTLTLHQGLHEHLLAHLSQTKDLSFGFWLLALGGLPAAACLKRLRPALFFSVSLWLFAFVGTAAGLYFRGHYFILLLPAFAILLGLAVTAWRDLMPAKFLPDVLRSLPVIVFALILGWNLYYYEAVYFEWPADQVAQQLYRENPFSEAVAAAELIRDHSFPDARIAVIGSEPEIYFYAHRHSATGYIYTYPLMESQPYASVMQQDMVREIESAHPEFLVQVPYPLSWLPQPGSSPYLIDWSTNYAAQFYHPIATVGFAPGRGLVATWNPGTTNLPPLTGEYLTIYQRLPGTEP